MILFSHTKKNCLVVRSQDGGQIHNLWMPFTLAALHSQFLFHSLPGNLSIPEEQFNLGNVKRALQMGPWRPVRSLPSRSASLDEITS